MDAQAMQAGQSLPKSDLLIDALPGHQRFELWRESVMPLFEAILDEPQASHGFNARVEGYHLQSMLMGMSSFSGQRFRRVHTCGGGENADHFLIQVYMTGGCLGHNGQRDVDCELGDISLLDLGYPLETCTPNSTNLTLVVPRELLYLHMKSAKPVPGMVIPAGSPLGKIVGNHLLTVWRALPSATVADTPAITQVLLGVLAGAFSGPGAADETSTRLMERATLEAICRYIDQNLSSTELSPALLCQQFGCSRAHLYRLFQTLGGIATYIREARLKRCRDELREVGRERKRIAEVASRWGFANQSHFCRIFREYFGVAPGEVFEKAMQDARVDSQHTCTNTKSDLPVFRDWLVNL